LLKFDRFQHNLVKVEFPGGKTMTEIILKIEGMSCQHCVMSVKKALGSVRGVSSAEVSVGSAKIVFDESKTGKEDITLAIQKAGYKVVG